MYVCIRVKCLLFLLDFNPKRNIYRQILVAIQNMRLEENPSSGIRNLQTPATERLRGHPPGTLLNVSWGEPQSWFGTCREEEKKSF